ncbi:TerC family protein [Micromonospora endophytica]|uniref:Tellurium resistance protein TerC n=1 Tax=Micromonospora endophytica TaxID=515350 RepID=A0A2W2CEU3_9ACTN|nr:TerC family protein [Micromonospora endophytica]PZF97871.1 tellurium resistance protein TerC [Micromonospora endophytica]RIW41036.1 TerC family protein [Micromonospora endophytica]BCJ61282.1 integral membrane protein TerC (tellurium resistance) [Micromonospora endophytica]
MNVSGLVWGATLVALTAVLLVDLLIIGRRPHEPSVRESSLWVAFYVALALFFGAGLWLTAGASVAGQFYTGWLTEYSLSVDNLFVFMIIMARFAVPRQYQQKVLLIGIVLALVMRGAFIAAGAALISQFSWVFYIFGAFLIYTAINLARQGESAEEDFQENVLIRWSRRALPISRGYDGAALTVRQNGRRMFTPMLIVMIAIGTTDLIFALDSIPAIFGITHEPYLVFTANVFALMGLRQLYFLLGGLLERLIFLSYGLAVVLGFIGVKLILEALADNKLSFLNGGEPIGWAPHIPIWLSLLVILVTLTVATIASLVKSSRDRRRELAGVGPREPSGQ